MSYKVIHYFVDLQDFNHPYKVGDTFPRLGLTVSEGRLRELSGSNNKQGVPLIEKVEKSQKDDFAQYMNPPKEVEKGAYTKTEINRMSTADLKKLAKGEGIEEAEDMSGADLKKVLIKKFGL